MPTTVFSDESLSFLPQQWIQQQSAQIDIFPSGNASSSGSSCSSDSSSSCNEGSHSPVRSPDTTTEDTNGGPYLLMINQPHNKFRFRYKTEMQGTHGAILSINGKRGKKEYPKVKLCNYTQSKDGCNPIIRCTLYTANEDENKRVAHVHRLVGKKNGEEQDDPHDFIVQGPSYIAELKNLTILFTKKEDQEKILMHKKLLHARRKFTNDTHSSLLGYQSSEQIRSKVQEEMSCINLNVACLRFDALVDKGQGVYVPICKPIYSTPINNMKNPHTNELRICRVSKCSGSCLGDEEVFILVEKVVKKNIKVKFFEEGPNKEIIWEDYGVFTPDDVHHQYAIVFRTPPYRDPNIKFGVEVCFLLERPSDNAVSDVMVYEYRPIPNRHRDLYRKRPRLDSAPNIPLVLNNYQQTSQTLGQEISIDVLDDMLAPLTSDQISTTTSFDDILRLIDKDDLLMEQGNPFTSFASSDVSFGMILDNIPSADSDALSQFLSNERIEEYAIINGQEEAANMLRIGQGQVAAGPKSDLVLDGFCRLLRHSAVLNSASDNHQVVRDRELPQSQMDSGNPTIPSRVMNITPAKLMFNETNIVERIEIALDNLLKIKKMRRLTEKFFQSLLIRLFSYTVEGCDDRDDSVLHILAASKENPVPPQALKFINKLKVFNVIDCLIEIQNNKNETPLLVAAARGSPYMVSLLLEAGADVNATDYKNNTAMHLAVLRDTNNLEIVDALSAKDPDLIKYNEEGYTAFHLAVYRRKSDLISAFLVKSEDVYKEDLVNRRDRKRGNTALHIAVENRFKEIIKLLLNFEDKIEIDATNFEGKTPLAFVMEETDRESKKIAQMLLACNADPSLVITVKSKKEDFEFEPELEIMDADLDGDSQDEISAYAREWDENELFDKTTISQLCPLLDKNDDWVKLFKRLKFNNSEIDYCRIHWSPTLSAFKVAELSKPEVTAETVRDELMILAPHLRCGAQFIDDMLLRRLGLD